MHYSLTSTQIFGLRTNHEISIENFEELGKVVIPKGTKIIPNERESTEEWVTGDVYLSTEIVLYGVTIPATAVADANTGQLPNHR
jgi:hypothetical protein